MAFSHSCTNINHYKCNPFTYYFSPVTEGNMEYHQIRLTSESYLLLVCSVNSRINMICMASLHVEFCCGFSINKNMLMLKLYTVNKHMES